MTKLLRRRIRRALPDHAALIAAAFADAPTRTSRPRTGSHTGRNLLLGILALQNNFISRAALLDAFTTWVMDKSRSLGDILERQEAISPERRNLLEALVAEHFQQQGGDPEASLAAVGSAARDYNFLFTINDAELRAGLTSLSAATTDWFDGASATSRPAAPGRRALPWATASHP